MLAIREKENTIQSFSARVAGLMTSVSEKEEVEQRREYFAFFSKSAIFLQNEKQRNADSLHILLGFLPSVRDEMSLTVSKLKATCEELEEANSNLLAAKSELFKTRTTLTKSEASLDERNKKLTEGDKNLRESKREVNELTQQISALKERYVHYPLQKKMNNNELCSL